jgi:hypothetical protein
MPTGNTALTAGRRLVAKPAFLLSSIRSGSTLLRCMLNSHPAICAPHELHLRYLTAQLSSEYTELAMTTLGYTAEELRWMLWDRVLRDQLDRSGKSVIVDKSPSNVFIVSELLRCWPTARFIVLRRHPAAIVASIVNADDGRDKATAIEQVLRYAAALDAVLQVKPATPIVRYEDLVDDPTSTCRQLCRFLNVNVDDSMVEYGRHDHGPFIYGIGDWGERIRSGRVVQAPQTAPPLVPAQLTELCQRWGYASQTDAATQP